jgi:hypothetical protein
MRPRHATHPGAILVLARGAEAFLSWFTAQEGCRLIRLR